MSRPVNTLKLIKTTKDRINVDYDISITDIIELKDSSVDTFNLICNAFVLGYAQGVKAQKKGCAYNG